MRQKTIAIITALILAISLSAYGSNKPTASNDSDVERIEELEKANTL